MVVEESPVKKRHRVRRSEASDNENGEDETLEDEEEDEVSDEEEEEEKYDIDDLSASESNKTTPEKTSPQATEENFSGIPPEVAQRKAAEEQADQHNEDHRVREAARALAKGTPMMRKYVRSRSRSSGLRSGLETPDRFHGPHPHPPKLSPRHVAFAHEPEVSSSSSTLALGAPMERDTTLRSGERGARDDLHSPRSHLGARSRIPHDRDVEGDTLRTPTAFESAGARSPNTRRRRSRERAAAAQMAFDSDAHPRRAFAVWGQDESDSATSDSDY